MAVITKQIVLCDLCGKLIKSGTPMITYQTGDFNDFGKLGYPMLTANGKTNYAHKKYAHINRVCLSKLHKALTAQYVTKSIPLDEITETKVKV